MVDNEPKINELPEDMRAKFDALREEFNKAMEPVSSKEVLAGLETVRCVIKTHPCISQAEKPALCRRVENGIKLIEDLEERVAIMEEPGKGFEVYSIDEGHARIGLGKSNGKYIILFAVAEEYRKPGMTGSAKEPKKILFGYQVRDSEHVRVLAKCLEDVATWIEEWKNEG